MYRTIAVVLAVSLLAACGDQASLPIPDPPGPTPEATAATSPTTQAVTTVPEASGLAWQRTDFVAQVGGNVLHVSDLLLTSQGILVAGLYGEGTGALVASADIDTLHWEVSTVPGGQQTRDIVELPDGSLLLTGSTAGSAIVWRNSGAGWVPVGTDDLPRRDASLGWDLEVLDDGSVLLATDSLANDPARDNPAVHRSTDGGDSWATVAILPGLGALALAELPDGTVLAATEESAEHDDPATAGQAWVYRSTDGGVTWGEPVALPGANRVYTMTVISDGSVWAGTGISGEILRSDDGGRSWSPVTHVPSTSMTRPDGEAEVPATRVYSILELADGRILAGTGNQAGDVFVTSDGGQTWQPTGSTGPNNVVWGLLQAPDGTIWVGTGSSRGDLLHGTG